MRPRLRIPLDKHRPHPQIFPKFNIRERIPHHRARPCLNLRKIPPRRLKHPRQRLPAIAALLVMRTVIEPIHPRPCISQNLVQLCVDIFHILRMIDSQRNPALIRHHQHPQPRRLQPPNRLRNPVQQSKFLPPGHILALRHLAVDHPVTVQENGLQQKGTISRLHHAAMITTAARVAARTYIDPFTRSRTSF